MDIPEGLPDVSARLQVLISLTNKTGSIFSGNDQIETMELLSPQTYKLVSRWEITSLTSLLLTYHQVWEITELYVSQTSYTVCTEYCTNTPKLGSILCCSVKLRSMIKHTKSRVTTGLNSNILKVWKEELTPLLLWRKKRRGLHVALYRPSTAWRTLSTTLAYWIAAVRLQ